MLSMKRQKIIRNLFVGDLVCPPECIDSLKTGITHASFGHCW